jgi:hypothetical protein
MRLYPNILELKLMFSLYKMMKTVNKKAPQKYFHSLVDGHGNELINKNFDYFLSDEFSEAQVNKILVPLKQHFLKLDEETKDMIWKHLIVLYHLSLQCEEKIDIKNSLFRIQSSPNGLETQNSGSIRETSSERGS